MAQRGDTGTCAKSLLASLKIHPYKNASGKVIVGKDLVFKKTNTLLSLVYTAQVRRFGSSPTLSLERETRSSPLGNREVYPYLAEIHSSPKSTCNDIHCGLAIKVCLTSSVAVGQRQLEELSGIKARGLKSRFALGLLFQTQTCR